MHGEKCPVCLGYGGLEKGGYMKPCHGCGGKGWVEVRDEPKPEVMVEQKFVTNPEKSDEE